MKFKNRKKEEKKKTNYQGAVGDVASVRISLEGF